MTSDAASVRAPRGSLGVEVWLGIAGLLTFVLVPIRINTIYSGLPAHPLFLHVPVILIPVAAIATLVLVARPRHFMRHGPWITAVAVIALGATNLTIEAGKALRQDLHLGPGSSFGGANGPAGLIARHAHAADILRLLMIVFTALLIIALALYRHSDASSTGIPIADRILTGMRRISPSLAPLRVVLAVLAIGCLYFVYHTGDLGAKAVWQGRLSHAGGGGPGAGFPGGGYRPSGSGGSGGSGGVGFGGG